MCISVLGAIGSDLTRVPGYDAAQIKARASLLGSSAGARVRRSIGTLFHLSIGVFRGRTCTTYWEVAEKVGGRGLPRAYVYERQVGILGSVSFGVFSGCTGTTVMVTMSLYLDRWVFRKRTGTTPIVASEN